MNSVFLIGRAVKDPAALKSAVRLCLAVDRGKGSDGQSLGTDNINVVCFGKTAGLAEKYALKGRLVAVKGRILTGSYEKDGKRIYTMDIAADRLEFLDGSEEDASEDALALSRLFTDESGLLDYIDEIEF